MVPVRTSRPRSSINALSLITSYPRRTPRSAENAITTEVAPASSFQLSDRHRSLMGNSTPMVTE